MALGTENAPIKTEEATDQMEQADPVSAKETAPVLTKKTEEAAKPVTLDTLKAAILNVAQRSFAPADFEDFKKLFPSLFE
jgi:hypothetical protein